MDEREGSHSANIQATTAKLFDPILDLCLMVKAVSKVVTDRLPSQDEIWAAQRKGELSMAQIKAVRQCETRLDVDQEYIEGVVKRLDDMEESMATLEDKAEEIESVVEQKMPMVKELLLSKYQFALATSAPVATSPKPELVNESTLTTENRPVIPKPVPRVISTSKPVKKLKTPQKTVRLISATKKPPTQSPRNPGTSIPRPSATASLAQSYDRLSFIPKPVPKVAVEGSGIKPPGFRQSQSPLTTSRINMLSSFHSPRDSYMPAYKPAPQSATVIRHVQPAATPQQQWKFRPNLMSAAHSQSAMSLNHQANYSASKHESVYRPAPVPVRSHLDDIDSVLARLERKC